MTHFAISKRRVYFLLFATVALLMSTAVARSQQGYLIPSPLQQQYPIKFEVLSSLPDGTNLNSYTDPLYFNIQRNLLARLPESALNGEKGVVVVRVQIGKDGSLPEEAVKIVFSYGKEDMDAAAVGAIRAAAPFMRLPDWYAGSKLDLLFTFGFAPQNSSPKPKFLPVSANGQKLQEKSIQGFRAGVNGVGVPKCVYCPGPEYSEKARKAGFTGEILLEVTVTSDGKVVNPAVIKGPGLGLEEKALAQATNWIMKPASGPNGKPVNCRVQILMTWPSQAAVNTHPAPHV